MPYEPLSNFDELSSADQWVSLPPGSHAAKIEQYLTDNGAVLSRPNDLDRRICDAARENPLREGHDSVHNFSDVAHGVYMSWLPTHGDPNANDDTRYWVCPTDDERVLYEIPRTAFEPWTQCHQSMFGHFPGRQAATDALVMNLDELLDATGPDTASYDAWCASIRLLRSWATCHAMR